MSFASALVEAGTAYPPRTHRFISTFVVRIELFFISFVLFFCFFLYLFVFFGGFFSCLCSVSCAQYCLRLRIVYSWLPFGFPLGLFISIPKTHYSIFSVILLTVRLMLGGSAYWWSFLKRVMCTKLDIFQFINVTWESYQVSTWSLNR